MAIWYVNPSRKRSRKTSVRRRGLLRRNPKRQVFMRGKGGKRLYGAAAEAKRKSLRKKHRKVRKNPSVSKEHRRQAAKNTTRLWRLRKARKNPTMAKRRRRYRRNPAGRPKGATWTHVFSAAAKGPAAEKKMTRKLSKKYKKGMIPLKTWQKARAKLAKSYKRKGKRKGMAKSKKSAKRVAAGKKAARTRAKKRAARRASARKAARRRKSGGKKGKSRKTGKSKTGRKSAKRVAAGKKGARTRARNRRARRGKARSGRRMRRRRFRGLRALKRARRSIKRAHSRRGGKRARSFVRYYKMRTNPSTSGVVGVMTDVLKKAMPVMGGFLGSRMLAAQASRVEFLNKLGQHRDPVVATAVVLALGFFGDKLPVIGKYKNELLVGAGVNVLDVLLKTYAPSIAGQLGVGEYLNMGEYIEYPGAMGEYDYELGEYMDELGDYPSQIAAVPQGRQLAAAAEYGDVSQTDLYSGVFASSMLS